MNNLERIFYRRDTEGMSDEDMANEVEALYYAEHR